MNTIIIVAMLGITSATGPVSEYTRHVNWTADTTHLLNTSGILPVARIEQNLESVTKRDRLIIAETFYGSSGNDAYYGTVDADIAKGNSGIDELHGAENNDTLEGGSGADSFDGGPRGSVAPGNSCTGNSGRDSLIPNLGTTCQSVKTIP